MDSAMAESIFCFQVYKLEGWQVNFQTFKLSNMATASSYATL